MPDHDAIYQSEADRYDRLIAREDWQGNLSPAMAAIRAMPGLDIVELGAGTGRLTRLVAPAARRVVAFDASGSMLDAAHDHLVADGSISKVVLQVADHRSASVPPESADLILSGWSIAYDVCQPQFLPARLEFLLARWNTMLRQDGTILIIESLGTGTASPAPKERLVPYYEAMTAAGFDSTSIRTDYRFSDIEEADGLVRFFFGEALADRVVAENLTILPECTGLWWRHGRRDA